MTTPFRIYVPVGSIKVGEEGNTVTRNGAQISKIENRERLLIIAFLK
jgi:hypothetical protein